MAPIELKNIWKTFGDKTIIQDANLAIADGEFVALVGPSGCGKSTLLRMIAGLEEVTGGEITVGGKTVDTRNHRGQNIAMVFQSYALYPNMTVAQNIGFNLRVAGRSKSEIRERVEETARILDLTELLDRKPAQLSGGQRQRVAMGRAMVRKPNAFLFDEPLSNLDAKLRVQMRSELKLLHQRLSTTSIYVTHDQIEAMTLADRIVVMNKGRIEQEGAPLDLYEQPRTRFVAGFIGSPQMNFLDAEIIEHEGRLKAHIGNEMTLDLGLRDMAGTRRNVVIGIRPEHLVRSAVPAAMTGGIALLEPTGAQTFVRLRVGAQQVTAVVAGGSALGVGQVFHADVEPKHLHVFDHTSGLRLN